MEEKVRPDFHADWFVDVKLKGVCNHETRGHIRADLHRYFFAAVFARQFGRSPLLEDFPKALLPKHGNVAAALKETKFNDRFRVQLAGRPSTTVVSHSGSTIATAPRGIFRIAFQSSRSMENLPFRNTLGTVTSKSRRGFTTAEESYGRLRR